MEEGNSHGHLWSIVLAGGDGVRTKAFIRGLTKHDARWTSRVATRQAGHFGTGIWMDSAGVLS
jgi:hypothetical protein